MRFVYNVKLRGNGYKVFMYENGVKVAIGYGETQILAIMDARNEYYA